MTLATFDRQDSLVRLRSEQFDVVVVGGGITGAGVALDAAARGLKTALVDRCDFASGTSSKSSKLIHGGLRYLQHGDIRLVYEALAERQRLLDNAPHLVSPLPFLIPMFGKDGVIPAKIARVLGAAMWGYDLTGGIRLGKLHRRVTQSEALDYMPTLKPQNLVSGYVYFDAAADDARLVTAVCRTAALHHGAVCANYVAVTGFRCNSSGQLNGVEVSTDGETFTINTSAVVNAAGVWSDELQGLAEGTNPDTIRPAKGIHITVPHSLVRNTIAAVIPVPKDKRSIFVVPLGDFAYIGTTDTDYDGPLDDPTCTTEDVQYLLTAFNHFATTQLTPADVTGTWAGLRPLVKAASSGRTADLSRGHRIQESPNGMVSITGGKLTTYRHMAEDTVDLVLKRLTRSAQAPLALRSRTPGSTTKRLRLRGADGYEHAAEELVDHGFSLDTASHLARRFGGEIHALADLIAQDETLAAPLIPGLPYLRAEAVFAVRSEMATSVDDVLSRRTRARLLGRDACSEAADSVAELIGSELGWSPEKARASAAEFQASTEHERLAAHLPPVDILELLHTGVEMSSPGI